MTTWTDLRNEAITIVKNDFAAQWPLIQVPAATQMQAFIAAAQYAKEHQHEIPPDEHTLLRRRQERCFEAMPSGFRDIGETLA